MKHKSFKLVAVVLYALFDILIGGAAGGFLPQATAQAFANPTFPANANGRIMVSEFAKWQFQSQNGISSGAQTVTLNGCYIKVGTAYVQFYPIATNASLLITDGANTETVTPTAVSQPSLANGASTISQYSCTFTATFSNSHTSAGFGVSSGDGGLIEAMNYAAGLGGGIVTIDPSSGITNAQLTAAVPYGSVLIEDLRAPFTQAWAPAQSTSTVLAAPATLTATTVGFGLNGASTTGGTYTGTSTYVYCVAYVDVMGNEGPCSATFSAATAGTGATNQIGFAAPAASTGAVGYTVYISLASGTYNLAYQAPLTSTTCTLTKVETVTPACAVTNANYNQTGSNAVISALPVNTAPLHLLATTASTTSAYIGSPSGRTTYAYAPVPVSSVAAGLTSAQQVYAIAPATATTVPSVIATIPVPIGSMNYVGRTLCIEGQATEASAGSTATIQNIEFLWDAAGSNTAGAGVIIGQLQLTATLVTANADNWSFHECFQTTVAGAGVTAGSIQPIGGQLISTYGAGVLGNAGTEVLVAPVASLNLAGTGGNTQRIDVVWLHTTGTDAAGVKTTALRAYWQ